MSQYPAIEAAVLALVCLYDDPADAVVFTAAHNATINDYRALDAAGTRYAVVLHQHRDSRFGERLDERRAHKLRHKQEVHSVRVSLFVKRADGDTGDGVAYTLLQGAAAALAAHIERYPLLNATPTVTDAAVDLISAPAYVGPRDQRATHIGSDVIVTVWCLVSKNQLEQSQ